MDIYFPISKKYSILPKKLVIFWRLLCLETLWKY